MQPIKPSTDILHPEYDATLARLLGLIHTSKMRAISAVNTLLIQTYWEIGREIEQQKVTHGWGAKVIEQLSHDLQAEFPGEKGFSIANLKNMSLFYREFPEFSQTVSSRLSWTSHILILTACKSVEERRFYRMFAEREDWSYRELRRQIDTDLCTRVVGERDPDKIIAHIDSLASSSRDLSHYFRDEYVLDFIDGDRILLERDLELAILDNLALFFLEWGKGEISLIGQQYPCIIDGEEHRIDLLLYHRELQCLVVLELKTTKFQAEYVGQVNKYISYLNKYKRKDHEHHPIGIILCKEASQETIEFALDGLEEKMKVAVYKSLPSQQVLHDQIQKIEQRLYRKMEQSAEPI